MTIDTNADVAAKVRGATAEKRLKQADLAAALSMSEMAISRRLSGTTPFTPEELIRAARFLDRSVGSFFGERAA